MLERLHVSILIESSSQDQSFSPGVKFVSETILESPNQLICQSIPRDLSWLYMEERNDPSEPYSNY